MDTTAQSFIPEKLLLAVKKFTANRIVLAGPRLDGQLGAQTYVTDVPLVPGTLLILEGTLRNIIQQAYEEGFKNGHHGAPAPAPRQPDPADRYLSPAQLDDRYNFDGDGEHPCFPRSAWRHEVSEENTLVSYWEWVSKQLDEYPWPAA